MLVIWSALMLQPRKTSKLYAFNYKLQILFAMQECRNLNFYSKLNMAELSPASLLFKWFGKREWDAIASKFNIMPSDYVGEAIQKICAVFAEVAIDLKNYQYI